MTGDRRRRLRRGRGHAAKRPETGPRRRGPPRVAVFAVGWNPAPASVAPVAVDDKRFSRGSPSVRRTTQRSRRVLSWGVGGKDAGERPSWLSTSAERAESLIADPNPCGAPDLGRLRLWQLALEAREAPRAAARAPACSRAIARVQPRSCRRGLNNQNQSSAHNQRPAPKIATTWTVVRARCPSGRAQHIYPWKIVRDRTGNSGTPCKTSADRLGFPLKLARHHRRRPRGAAAKARRRRAAARRALSCVPCEELYSIPRAGVPMGRNAHVS